MDNDDMHIATPESIWKPKNISRWLSCELPGSSCKDLAGPFFKCFYQNFWLIAYLQNINTKWTVNPTCPFHSSINKIL